jgi:uncharacterized protein (DUF2164 family)
MPAGEWSKEQRAEAISSIQRYFEENGPEPLGQLAAGLLLDFFLKDLGPVVYNQGVADAQARMERLLSDLPGDLHAPEFLYWQTRRPRR